MSTVTSRPFRRYFAILLFSFPTFAIASPGAQIRAALGSGQVRENLCLAILETTRTHGSWTGTGKTQALNAFSGLAQSLKAEEAEPKLTRGYAVIEQGQVQKGSLSRAAVAARLQAIFTMENDSLGESGSEKNRIKLLTLSTSSSSSTQAVLDDLRHRLQVTGAKQLVGVIHTVTIVTLLGVESLGMIPWALNQPELGRLLFALLGLYLLNDGQSLPQLVPGHGAVDNMESAIDQFLSEDPAQKSGLLISESAELSESLVRNGTRPNSGWSEWDKQLEIGWGRLPSSGIAQFMNFINGTRFKSVWVHSDLLIERDPDGSPQIHVLIQFTEKEPRFPRQRKRQEVEDRKYDFGVRPPVPVPIPK